jgi:hypothetical protein
MAYVGNAPAVAYTNTVKDTFSGNGSTVAFTMSLPSTTNNVRVVVENVIQDPTVAYSVSGTTLTFTSAPPSGTNNIYVVHLGPAVQTVQPPTQLSGNFTLSGDLAQTGDYTLTGALDATNLTRDGSQVYSRDNILGTVSQSAGVPTGAIIERGSNANGDYVRFADGTQICWNNETVTPEANTYTFYTWTFPAEFSVTPSITVSANSASTAVVNTQFSAPSATSARIGINRTNTTNTTLSSQAIGRWF